MEIGWRGRVESSSTSIGFRTSEYEFLDQLAYCVQISRSYYYSGRLLEELSTGIYKAVVLD